ncbi:MAG: PIN domain-containing protein [Pyrinomonadaceae bacterium]
MNVLVDTSVWSLALRRDVSLYPVSARLKDLIVEGRAAIIGPVRQELLSGIKVDAQFEMLKGKLRAFPDIELKTEDHEEAARFFNVCRTNGIQGSNTDFLICAVAARRELPIFTTDHDFDRFTRHIPISLYT